MPSRGGLRLRLRLGLRLGLGLGLGLRRRWARLGSGSTTRRQAIIRTPTVRSAGCSPHVHVVAELGGLSTSTL